jgi:hypothetical protein
MMKRIISALMAIVYTHENTNIAVQARVIAREMRQMFGAGEMREKTGRRLPAAFWRALARSQTDI